MRRKALSLAVACALVLAGCSSLPSSGPVTSFERDIPDAESLVLKGYGPVAGSAPDILVRDFLRASAAGLSDDFQVARSYLTDRAKAAWRPESQVQIYSDDQTPLVTGDGNTVSVSVGVGAVVTPDGSYEGQATAAKTTLEYKLTSNAQGQWRIDELPDGVLLSQSSFHAVYTQVSVYFLAPDYRALVPDRRWYPLRRLESHLMQALIEGPSSDIAPAVVSAIPEGARLPLQQVSVTAGTADVELEGEYLVSPDQQEALKWQVTSTLAQVPGVTEVRVNNNGMSLDDVAIPPGPTWAMDKRVGFSKAGLVLRDRSFTTVVVPASEQPGAHSASVGPVDSSPLAFINADKLFAVRPGSKPVQILAGEGISRPSIDRLDWIWTVVGNEIVATNPTGDDSVRIASPWQDGRSLQSISISPDGARALLRRDDDGSGSVWMAAVKRNAQGKPAGIDVPRRVELDAATVVDMSWAGNTSALILQQANGAGTVTISSLGSVRESLDAPADAIRISGGATPQAVLLDTKNEVVYSRFGVSWRNSTTDLVGESYPH
ncbi:LpqB family beta-propeller domain-containing protein [Gleimia europaea]|uniref:GerMN domain-containing protein n=1 Tax=Gleimia europaea ACS-120-V-Col10b TaxID=883069 RepID=A0A9W5RE85_9ACTO|nr:LpqB family beta-propeller domain-containing protein [Gleimia europaea]EPD30807.1 hypothetical protein HMPREF9238_00562 [Gleimia europaea ACS-120-V-Col10b]